MVTETILEETGDLPRAASTAGITTKVVKGSIWTLAGQVVPLVASLASLPFVIRFLGSESYGVLILVSLIPSNLSFASFGMETASTRFASEAYARGSREDEAGIIRMAALIAFLTSLFFALPIFIFSFPVIAALNVPEGLRGAASIALKIASITFVVGILGYVVNTPQLTRLRMDLNAAVGALPKVLMSIATPTVLYFGFGIVGCAWVAFFAAAVILAGHLYFSGRLLPELFKRSVRIEFAAPLLKFGRGLLFGTIAGILLINLEKLILTRLASVQSLAYYSVAFSLALMATLFTSAMQQSLIPAFSQLLSSEKKGEFDSLFSRSIRLTLIWLLPAIMLLFVAAKPFFTIWAGADFGRESTLPFYILLLGLFFNILAHIPHSTIISKGRTDIFAKLYWIELPGYAVLASLLIYFFHSAGAAAAWTTRVIIDASVIIWFSKRVAKVPFRILDHFGSLFLAALMLTPPAIFAVLYDNYSLWLIPIVLLSVVAYFCLIWRNFAEQGERSWMIVRLARLRKFLPIFAGR